MPIFLIVVLLVGACNEVEVEDPSLRAAGADLGKAAVALMTAPVPTDFKGMEKHLAAVESELAILALGFDALGIAGAVLPENASRPVPPGKAPGSISWDGKRLEATLDGLGDNETRLVAHLDYSGYRRETVSPGSEGCWWGERDGDQSVQCPAIILHTLNFTRPADGLTVHATFGVTLDGDDCAAGGQVKLDYAIRKGEETRGGSLQSTYNGCGRIRIMASN